MSAETRTIQTTSGGTRLWTHYDAMDNALIQLHGEKRVLLFPPRVSAGLYLEGSSSPVVGWEVDGHEKNETDDGTKTGAKRKTAFPAYRAARREAREVRLQPGDVLFIPALWAHHTEAVLPDSATDDGRPSFSLGFRTDGTYLL